MAHPLDDEHLLAELGAAVREAREVPARFVAAGRAAFAWHDIDAELAGLAYDSAAGTTAAGTRGTTAARRTLTFAAGRLTIELEVTADALRGQVVPSLAGVVELSGRDGAVRMVTLDDVGWFVVRPVPAGLVRLLVRTSDGLSVVTEWVTL
jgi:hypothetical protein